MARKPRNEKDETPPEVIEGEAVEVTDQPASEETGNGEAAEVSHEPTAGSDPSPEPVPVAKPRRGGFFALVLGGAVAAAIGFAAARYVVPDGWPFPGVAPEPDPLALALDLQGARLDELAGEIAALKADGRLAALEQGVAALRGDTRIDDIGAAVNALSSELPQRLTALEQQVNELGLAPGAVDENFVAANIARQVADLESRMRLELADIQKSLAEVKMRLQTAKAEAASLAGQSTLDQLLLALDTGEPIAPYLADLSDRSGIAIPDALERVAVQGVPTLAELQAAFPDAARVALKDAMAQASDSGDVSRIEAFLRSQLGARSLEPREGADPDAVLSRAEAALRSGDLVACLDEVAALPEQGQAAMAGWTEQARVRLNALQAGDELARQLNQN